MAVGDFCNLLRRQHHKVTAITPGNSKIDMIIGFPQDRRHGTMVGRIHGLAALQQHLAAQITVGYQEGKGHGDSAACRLLKDPVTPEVARDRDGVQRQDVERAARLAGRRIVVKGDVRRQLDSRSLEMRHSGLGGVTDAWVRVRHAQDLVGEQGLGTCQRV
jgi:hypothetical protein